MKTGSGSHVIVRNPRVQGGEPIVRDTRVPLRSIVIAFERYGGDLDRVGKSFTLELDQVRAALAYYEARSRRPRAGAPWDNDQKGGENKAYAGEAGRTSAVP